MLNRRSFIKITAAVGAGVACAGSLMSTPVKAVARSLGRRTCVWAGRSGEWDDPEMWVDRQIPLDGDDVIIRAGHMMASKSHVRLDTLTVYGGMATIGSDLDRTSIFTTIRA